MPASSPAPSLTKRHILITSALPYANAGIHIGHLVEYSQADVWARFQRMRGHEVRFVGADDTHGTPVMLSAQKAGISPEQLIERVWREHKRDFDAFQISFDHYYSTHSPENRELAETFYRGLKSQGLIAERTIEQLFDPVQQMFLPDRFVKGECPRCGAADQYGDSCEVCGATYAATELRKPYSVLSGATPQTKASEHYFFKLSDPRCESFLRAWTQDGKLQPDAANKMKEWLGEAGASKLADWDISRDPPYFGFEIPDVPGKFFYVWLDAPIGYYASLKNYCVQRGEDFERWVRPTEPDGSSSLTEQYHFIGKDILYFHALFWPAMLRYSGHRTPTNVFAHGFLTVGGVKMSKSRGTFITAQSYLDLGLDPQWLRYYFAVKLNATMEDLDLNLDDFIARVNSDLVGKYVNIASRTASFLSKVFGGRLADTPAVRAHPLPQQARAASQTIANLYEQREYGKAMRDIMQLADAVNVYVDQQKPWLLAKATDAASRTQLHEVCSVALEVFRCLSIYLAPVLPVVAQKVAHWLGLEQLRWTDLDTPVFGVQVGEFAHLMKRLERDMLDRLIAANKQSMLPTEATAQTVTGTAEVSTTGANTKSGAANKNGEATKDTKDTKVAKVVEAVGDKPAVESGGVIQIDDFAKVQLVVAKVLQASRVEGSDKLLQLQLDAGEAAPRTVFSGIAKFYAPEQLIGRLVLLVANLAPRKMRFGVSHGMVLAASHAGDAGGVHLIEAPAGALPGMRVN